MSWPWRRQGAIEPRRVAVSSRALKPGDGQGDTGVGLPHPARRSGRDDKEEAGGKELR
ncbi:MAG: hypothetical protein WCP70_14410 [Methanothrix sp.]